MPFNPLDTELEQQEIRLKFLTDTLVTRVQEDSKAGALIDAVLSELGHIRTAASERFDQLDPETAEGVSLDLWLDLFGLTKQDAEVAYVSEADEVVRMYVDEGTFGDLNSGADIVLSADSFVTFGEKKAVLDNAIERREVEFTLLNDKILPSADAEAWLSLIAVDEGQAYNITTRQLNKHNFVDYVANPNRVLRIENVEAIVNGEDAEDDETARSRLLRAHFSRVSTIEDTIVNLATTTPGVSEAFILSTYSGPGNLDIFIDTEAFSVPVSLVTQVADRIGYISIPGTIIRTRPVERVGVALSVEVKTKVLLDQVEQKSLSDFMRARIYDSLLFSGVGTEIDFLELHLALQLLDSRIARVGTEVLPYSSLTIYREGVGARVGSAWDPNIILPIENYQRVFVEDPISDPIQITFALVR